MEAISKHGSLNQIPKKEKKKLLSHYRHIDIKNELLNSSYRKCAFCECQIEKGGYVEIDHFAPKSLYPQLTFEWNNLLPLCKRCNIAKGNHDTIKEPIVNPSIQDPENYFDYNSLFIVPSNTSPDKKTSQLTIEVCNLNNHILFTARANLLVGLADYEYRLNEYLQKITFANTGAKQRKIFLNLKNSLDIIEDFKNKVMQYSGFNKTYLSRSKIYQEAIKALKDFSS